MNRLHNGGAAMPRSTPRLENALDDSGYLFQRFRDSLVRTGHAGIVAIRCHGATELSDATARAIALFIRIVGRKLHGRIAGGYRASDREFFLLLLPAGAYGESLFQADRETIRNELQDHFSLPHVVRGCVGTENLSGPSLAVDGLFLTNGTEENANNTLFRAFRELFSAFDLPQPVCQDRRERDTITGIIRNELIAPVFQPIINLSDGSLFGYESLSRVAHPGPLADPETLFAAAGRHGLTASLERLCRRTALARARGLALTGRIFLNVSPSLLQDHDHRRGFTASLLDELEIDRSRIVFELTERTMIDDFDLFRSVVRYYREQGYAIAIDDLGTGFAGLKMLAELEPDYVKLARYLISDIDRSATRQALVEALLTFCRRTGARVIAEGIEREEELDYLRAAGVNLGQGYLLARPSPHPFPDGACAMPGCDRMRPLFHSA